MSGTARAKALLLVFMVSVAIPFSAHSGSFVNFETPIIHGLALSPDGKSLAVCNLPDGHLDIYSVADSGLIGPVATIFVGLDPVSVRFQSSTEAWVVNHLSDSIAIVDIVGAKVTAILNTLESPEDVVFAGSPRRAFVSCSRANTIQTFDAVSHLAQPVITIDGERPKAMCVSPDGNTVYVAIFESGNSSTILASELTFLDNSPRASVVDMDIGPHSGVNPFPNLGTLFEPPISTNLTPSVPRRVSLIVKKDLSGRWMDDSNGNWTEFVSGTNAFLSGRKPGWTIPDHDVAMINTSNSVVRYIDGLMNICMDIAINPATGGINVVGTDARNELRFEPALKGLFSRMLYAAISANGSQKTVTDLNPHLSNSVRTLDSVARKQSLGDPRGIVWNSRGTRVYITGMGSNNLRMLDIDGNSVGIATDLEGGPSSLVYDENYNRLYVLGRFDGTVSVLDAETLRTISRVSMHDPTPDSIKLGRSHFYNTQQTSGAGHLACASCHIDARFDRLAWDLGNPAGDMKIFSSTNRNFSIFVPPATNHFHPLKGPMVTQSLQDIIGHEPFHWRGDRDGLED
ncbi:MAG: hypothetical protein JWM99_1126, partial [Verrucomicrobiales bacterium]|nr:hypothetical protein [Verrucomicrobiales bacterium]